jgi:hypothetical protein
MLRAAEQHEEHDVHAGVDANGFVEVDGHGGESNPRGEGRPVAYPSAYPRAAEGSHGGLARVCRIPSPGRLR